MFKVKLFESQIILKCLGARKPKGPKKSSNVWIDINAAGLLVPD
jgi:hypothetical protein